MPYLQKTGFVPLSQFQDAIHFRRIVTAIVFDVYRLQPEFGLTFASKHMDMRRFIPVRGIKPE
jgi:hypothetical protein